MTTATTPAPELLNLPTPITLEDYLALPDEVREGVEVVDGYLVEGPRVSWESSTVGANILIEIGGFVRAHKLGLMGGADFLVLLQLQPFRMRVPDVAFVSAARLSETNNDPKTPLFVGAPDLVVEVISPSNLAADTLQKIAEYLEAGVRLIWVVEPVARFAFVYRATGTFAVVRADGILDGEDVLPGFTLNLAEVWV